MNRKTQLLIVVLCLFAAIAAVYFFGRDPNESMLDAQAVANWGGGEQLIYGVPEATGTPIAIQVSDDGHLLTDSPVSQIFDVLPVRGSDTFTVAASITNTRVLTVVAGHGLTITDTMIFRDAGNQFIQQVGIVSIATNVITVDTPLDRAWAGNHPYGLTDMAVDGSSSAVTFQIGPLGGSADVTRFIVHMEDGTAMDDGKFGGIAALTNGVVIRVYRAATSTYDTIMNAKTNGEFAQRTYDASYADNAPAGTYGFRVRRSFGGEDKSGSVIRLANGDTFQIIIQDDLTGLLSFGIAVQGHLAH